MPSILSDTRILALVLGISFALIYLRIFENEFFKQIILIAIPSILVLFGSKWITNRWQIQSTKIKMKKEILDTYTNSAGMYRNLLHQFLGKFLLTYGKHDVPAYDVEKGISIFNFKIPKEISEQPKEKLKEDITKMQEEIDQSRRTFEPQMISLLRLYYRDEKMVDKYIEILKELGLLKNMIYDLMEPKTIPEIEKLAEKYNTSFRGTTEKIKNFAKILVDQDIQIT